MAMYSSYFMQASGMLEHCGITFSWGIEFGKGGPILAAKIGPGGRFWRRTDFFVTGTSLLRVLCHLNRTTDLKTSVTAQARPHML